MPSLRIPRLPDDTARAAEAAFGRDHLYLKIGREIAGLLSGIELPAPFLADLRLVKGFWPLSLASILQYWEDLTDHQMADAARTRLDLKYALHLPLGFPGFESLALCSFRQGVQVNDAGREAFRDMVSRLKGFPGSPVKRKPDAEKLIDTLCLLSRAEIIEESMGNAMEAIAACCPDWLLANALPHWYKCYNQKPGPQQIPRESPNIENFLHSIGKDGQYLLETIDRSGAPHCRELPEIQNLRHEWQRQFRNENGELTFIPFNCRACIN